ncbi:MAG: EF-P lysine aminoacylase GenX [Pirellulaceae bacterium]|nr:EF-P lysine aminoacylase GenX [Pirellulaceae bacterium]
MIVPVPNLSADDWQPTASHCNFQLRSEVLWRVRQFFHQARFLEVQPPLLSRDTVVDRHIDPVCIPGSALGLPLLSQSDWYLQTSPEFAMKRMLAAGAQRIYAICPVFRSGERGVMHNPEFTMLEWYRVGDDLAAAIGLLADLVRSVLPNSQPRQLRYQDAFTDAVGICPLSSSIGELADVAAAHRLGVDTRWSTDRDDWLDLLFAELVQPRFSSHQPTILTHFPASQAALARVCADDPRVAERFELFIGGVELANGYHELLDAGELAERNRRTSQQRRRDGKPELKSYGRMLAAMQAGLPPCSGCALGLDRLLMVLSSSQHIDQVISFPIERA